MKEQELMMTVLVGIVLMLLIIIVVIWFFNKGQKKILDSKMRQQQQELIFQKEMLLNTVKTQEAERERIAGELHDDITSKLNIIHLNVHLLKKQCNEAPEMLPFIDQIESSLTTSIERSRSISHELMPAIIKKFGLQFALKELINEIRSTGVLNINSTGEQFIKISDHFKQLHIFRIIQELVSNTLKYAKASEINLEFKEEADRLYFTYQDDGIGFDVDKISAGLGLGNIRTRCELLQATLKFGSFKNGKGISVTIKFPNHD